MLSSDAWNVLAPSLTGSPDSAGSQWHKRAREICAFTLAQTPSIVSYSEVDEYVDGKYFMDFFVDSFPLSLYFYAYLPKATSVDAQNIHVRHGNLLLIQRSQIDVLATLMLPMGEEESENQIANCVLLRHRKCAELASFAVVSVHLKSGTSARQMRSKQIEKILKLVDSLPAEFRAHVLLMGDFNQDALDLPGYASAYSQCPNYNNVATVPCDRTQANVEIASTNKKDSHLNNERLDYVFVSDAFQVDRLFLWQGTNVIKQFEAQNLSDHFPIVCTIRARACLDANQRAKGVKRRFI